MKDRRGWLAPADAMWVRAYGATGDRLHLAEGGLAGVTPFCGVGADEHGMRDYKTARESVCPKCAVEYVLRRCTVEEDYLLDSEVVEP